MDDNQNTTDFNLFLAAGALLGILEALHEMHADIPTDVKALDHFHDCQAGLTWAGKRHAHELHAFLAAASDRHRFPYEWNQLDEPQGVKEPVALYAVK